MDALLNIYESENEEMAYLRVNDKAPLRVSLDAIFELWRDSIIKVEEIAKHLISPPPPPSPACPLETRRRREEAFDEETFAGIVSAW